MQSLKAVSALSRLRGLNISWALLSIITCDIDVVRVTLHYLNQSSKVLTPYPHAE